MLGVSWAECIFVLHNHTSVSVAVASQCSAVCCVTTGRYTGPGARRGG